MTTSWTMGEEGTTKPYNELPTQPTNAPLAGSDAHSFEPMPELPFPGLEALLADLDSSHP